jgi:gamma-glutamylcyclotransferase (GGCT)/AIG2-like uncharacterized protein YtfP
MSVHETMPALAVYGTLAPGEPNHWVVSRIAGEWIQGTVRGYVFEVSWGPAEGYDGFLPDPDGHEVEVWVLQSAQLERSWRDIDDFEGQGYERRSIPVALASGQELDAQIYVALTEV